MKALFLTQGMPPPFVGGSGIYYFNIFKRFPPNELTIFTEHSQAVDHPDKEVTRGISFIRRWYIKRAIPSSNKFKLLWKVRGITMLANLMMVFIWGAELLVRFFLGKRPNVVYIGQLFPVGLLGLLLNRVFRINYIVFVHGEELTVKQGVIRRKLEKKILENAFRIIANSSFTRQLVIDLGIMDRKVVTVNPMLDSETFHPDYEVSNLRNKLGIDEDCKVLLTIGRLTKRKGHSRVISILPHLLSQIDNLKYLIVGSDIGEGERLRKLSVDLGVDESVIFVGRVADMAELPKYYCLCDVMVLPNYTLPDGDTEGFGMVFLEANACGKPVVGGLAGGTRDAVIHGETGFLVNYDAAADDDGLAEALIRLLMDEPYARKLGENGRQRVLTSFNWQRASTVVHDLGLLAEKD